jgi:hypothetical protein
VEITCRVYRPRKPRESPLFQLVERHLEELLRVWPVRFARQRGALRPVVERVLREFLKCGLLQHGFARLWCGECRRSVLVAFSCRGRPFCPSCEKRGQLLWADITYLSSRLSPSQLNQAFVRAGTGWQESLTLGTKTP